MTSRIGRSSLLAIASFLLFSGCDGGPGSSADAGFNELGCGPGLAFPAARWWMPSIGTTVGGTREVYLELERDCLRELELTLVPDTPGIVDLPPAVTIPANRSRATFSFTGLAEGVVQVEARAEHQPSGNTFSSTVELVVMGTTDLTCEGEASGTLSPGSELEGSLANAAIALQEGAAREDEYHVDPFEASIACADSVVPDGYTALGPAVRFGPTHTRLAREIPLTIPIAMALLPAGANRGHVEVAYLGPHRETATIVPIASPRFDGSAGAGAMTFEVPQLGTYQAVVRSDAPTRRRRRFTFRGILGFSMGGSGSGRIGFGNPERFDFVAPLGGPTDWTFMLEHLRRNHLGGFCTEAERQANPESCAEGSSLDRVPAPSQLHEHTQHYERWWWEEEVNDGSRFDRDDYLSILRDLTAMFGNSNYDRTEDPSLPNITPPGVPDEVRQLSRSERCETANQVVIPPFDGSANTGFFDDEYNPEGTHPVITFCDGANTDHIGEWRPGDGNNQPVEVMLAVDLNGNSIRDRGEPVIRSGREPWSDVGLDGIPSTEEVSPDGSPYDAIENPDPAGDDFDYQYNPTGTERNWARDTIDGDRCRAGEAGVAEPFEDLGLDGVAGTAQQSDGGFDTGEGNGCFDMARGARRMIETSPRWQAERMDFDTLRDTDLFADGGIRDLFNWVVMGNITTAGWLTRGMPVRFFNGHAALHMDGSADFDYRSAPYEEIGRAAMVRYGDPDVDERFLRIGDGGHVGTVTQLVDRLRSGLKVMDTRWPDGNRTRDTADRICAEGDREICGYVNSFVFDFTATTGRTGPVTVILPPGYFAEENAELRYPVVYFLHGYGMSPEDLVALGLLMWEAMNTPRVGTERRTQKMILVFPDGRCRNGECLRGTFYTDAPPSTPNGAQMQTFMLDLMDYVDTNYRTRMPEEFDVVE